MKSFENVFEESKQEAIALDLERDIFPSFRDKPGPYRFLTAVKNQYWNKDDEALQIASSFDSKLFELYLAKVKPFTGYSSKEMYVPLDTIDSRHIMMNCMIFSRLGKSINNIVEIGAGFGNWIRLNENIIDFKSWTMIDMAFVSRLQKWYVNQTVSNRDTAKFISVDEDSQFQDWIANNNCIDLVIGSHSLSEFSMDVFNLYFETVLTKTKYFFYATHKCQPSKSLISTKMEMLQTRFNIVDQIENQHGKCVNILYEVK